MIRNMIKDDKMIRLYKIVQESIREYDKNMFNYYFYYYF